MKKILALTLALMLALSLTAALAAAGSEGTNNLDLQVKVTSKNLYDVTVLPEWNVEIFADSLTWNVVKTDTLTGSAHYNSDTGTYELGDTTEHVYGFALADDQIPNRMIEISNRSNFDVTFEYALNPSSVFSGAFSLNGESTGTLVNKPGSSNSVSRMVYLDVGALDSDANVESGPAGSITITLSKSGDLYPYEQP